MSELNKPQPRLQRITETMKKARTEKRQAWILSRIIDIWDAEAMQIINN
jgi:23S rRNA maturation mini-RNase III